VKRTTTAFTAALYLCAIAPIAAAAQFPIKPIRLITPYPPGGGTDAVARPVAAAFNKAWGQPVVVDNRGGGGGIIAAQTVANAPPDGYTLFLSTGAQMVSAPLVMGKVPFDPHKDFRPVSLAALLPAFLVTQSSSAVASVQDMVAAARTTPGKLTFASSGTGGGHHLATEMLMAHTGIKIIHVPYKGGGLAVTALLGGEVSYSFSNLPAIRPHVQSGRLKILASCGAKRTALAPQAPTFVESGMPDFQYVSWYGFHYPARTPDAIVEQVNAELRRALSDRAIAEGLLLQGAEASPSPPEAVTRIMRDEHARWSKVIQTQNLKF
jgi:tripartite-type tricarboxylate transporter receptor subunit TctC